MLTDILKHYFLCRTDAFITLFIPFMVPSGA